MQGTNNWERGAGGRGGQGNANCKVKADFEMDGRLSQSIAPSYNRRNDIDYSVIRKLIRSEEGLDANFGEKLSKCRLHPPFLSKKVTIYTG